MFKMVKVKLPCFLLIVVVLILATVQSSSQATIQNIPAPHSSLSHFKERQKRIAVSGSTNATEYFVFPDDDRTKKPPKHVDNRIFMPVLGPNPPSCANGSTFCVNVDGYPTDHVKGLLQKEGHSFKWFLTNDVIEKPTSIHIQDRIGPLDDNPLCISKEEIIYPKTGENKNGDWLFVVNDENYRQGVRIETCVHNGECSFAQVFPNGYKTHCKQNYIYRTLVALNKNGESVSSDQFRLPSCCTCVVIMERGGLVDRIAQGINRPLPLTIPKTTPTSVTNSKKRNGK